jgi:hypothetical protein
VCSSALPRIITGLLLSRKQSLRLTLGHPHS